MNYLFIILSFLISSAVWSNGLDGKGIICNSLNKNYIKSVTYGFKFIKGSVEGNWIHIENDKVVVTKFYG